MERMSSLPITLTVAVLTLVLSVGPVLAQSGTVTQRVQMSGTITTIFGNKSGFNMQVAGRGEITVIVQQSTSFAVQGNPATSIDDLHAGDHVKVEGTLTGDNRLTAAQILVVQQAGGTPAQPVEMSGVITGFSPNRSSFTMQAQGMSRVTVFVGNGTKISIQGQAVSSITALSVGDRITVTGNLTSNNQLVATQILVTQQARSSTSTTSASTTASVSQNVSTSTGASASQGLLVRGVVVAKTPTTLQVAPSRGQAATTIKIDANTRVTGRRKSLADIAVGDTVVIHGQMNTSGAVEASQVEVIALGAELNSTTPAGAGASGSTGLSVDLGGILGGLLGGK